MLYRNALSLVLTFSAIILLDSCQTPRKDQVNSTSVKIPVILDTDANNELDDQHAMAYLFFNEASFDVKGVTVNATRSGGNIDNQYKEAERVMKLCAVNDEIPLLKGADKSFAEISPALDSSTYDGKDAVDFIIKSSQEAPEGKLVLIAVGKLTTVALAVRKDPTLVNRVRLVWLGSNYPEPGEYNQNNDTVSMNYLLNTPIEFEMVTVRYGKSSGTDAVKLTKQEANEKMPGLGPEVKEPVEGRHGGTFKHFGDYSVSLFEHIEYHGDPPSRALFDMAAVAIVKNPAWAEHKTIPAPLLVDNVWVERPENTRVIKVWENFNSSAIMKDFFESMGLRQAE